MSMQRPAPINRQPISAAITLGTAPLTISPTITARLSSACGARVRAGATRSISAGRLSTRKSLGLPCNWRTAFHGPTTSRVSPRRSFSSTSCSSIATCSRRKPTTLRSKRVRKASSRMLLPSSFEPGGSNTSAMPSSWDWSMK
ncbi:hypothetical protein D3C75_1015400 [compost metagenome]